MSQPAAFAAAEVSLGLDFLAGARAGAPTISEQHHTLNMILLFFALGRAFLLYLFLLAINFASRRNERPYLLPDTSLPNP